MRKLIATAALLAVTSVQAAEKLKFGDVNYFLKAGQVNLSADWAQTWNQQTKDIFNINENKDMPTKLRTRGNNLETRIGYALTDNFNLYLGLDAAFETKTENLTNNPKPTSSMTEGFSNPLLAANYRFLNQNSWRYNLDFGAIARVNLQEQRIGLPGNGRSTLANGRSSLELNSRFGRKWNEANEWQLAGGVIYNTSGDAKVGGQADIKADPSIDFFLRATYQYRPVNEFMMLLSAEGRRVGEFDYTQGGADVSANPHIDLNFLYTAKYLITENFIAKFNYGQSRLSNYTLQGAGNLGNDVDVKYRRANFWGLGLDFLF